MTKRSIVVTSGLILFVSVGVVTIALFPVLKGRYQYTKFLSTLQIGIDREEVQRAADAIGYERHDVEIPGKGIVASANGMSPRSFAGVYYFRNVMLNSIVVVEYDSTGRVVKIINDL